MHPSWASLLLLASIVSAQWVPPSQSPTNNLTFALEGPGLNGFIYNSSATPAVYNYCNMPHLSASSYSKPPRSYTLQYSEIIHRHHKRTPYASNQFPVESPKWDCTNTHLYFYGASPSTLPPVSAVHLYWRTYADPSNPIGTFQGNCQFPQITAGGLADSAKHGKDIWAAYPRYMPLSPTEKDVVFRATSNVITSQVAGALIRGMYPVHPRDVPVPILQQAAAVDSLQPSYSCPAADTLRGEITRHQNWTDHLTAIKPLLARLDAVTGVNPSDSGWHSNVDHYFDALTTRLCHSVSLPCSPTNAGTCVTEEDAHTIFRLGQWEYSFLYRDHPSSLRYAVLKLGVWLNELLSHLEDPGAVKYRHNVAHDGSVSLLLAVLQVDQMVWPGMGAEVVVERWRKDGEWVRILWGGRVMRMGWVETDENGMVSMEKFVAYIRGLVGEGASEIVKGCGYA